MVQKTQGDDSTQQDKKKYAQEHRTENDVLTVKIAKRIKIFKSRMLFLCRTGQQHEEDFPFALCICEEKEITKTQKKAKEMYEQESTFANFRTSPRIFERVASHSSADVLCVINSAVDTLNNC